MLKKLLLPVLLCSASVALAAPQRSTLTTENQFPELGHVEVGYDFTHHEFDATRRHEGFKYGIHEAFARVGVVDNLTLRLHAPVNQYTPDYGKKQSGFGDFRVGLDLVAYQDVFNFPYIIPHLDVSFDTGDEDKNLGAGENIYRFGVAIGTKTHEMFDWILDVSYTQNYDSKTTDDDDVFEVAFTWMWELSDQFTLNIEALVQDYQDTDNQPFLVGGGFSYKWTPAFQTSFFMGGWQQQESGEDLVFNVNAAYSF